MIFVVFGFFFKFIVCCDFLSNSKYKFCNWLCIHDFLFFFLNRAPKLPVWPPQNLDFMPISKQENKPKRSLTLVQSHSDKKRKSQNPKAMFLLLYDMSLPRAVNTPDQPPHVPFGEAQIKEDRTLKKTQMTCSTFQRRTQHDLQCPFLLPSGPVSAQNSTHC